MCEWFDDLNKGIRIILLIPIWGWIFSGLYRIFKYVDDSDNASPVTLVLGICCLIPIVGFVLSIIDIYTTVTSDNISFMA